MKRPQFGLRLMLLVVALAAAIIGWQTALYRLRQIDKKGEREGLQLLVQYFERDAAKEQEALENGDGWAASRLQRTREEIARLQERIDDLKH
jgi:hypothetical protein